MDTLARYVFGYQTLNTRTSYVFGYQIMNTLARNIFGISTKIYNWISNQHQG